MPSTKRNETKFWQNMKSDILRLGVFCYKTNDSVTHGIPDLYICGGNWIEAKVIDFPITRSIKAIRYIEPPQVTRMNHLQNHGDNCFVGINWQGNNIDLMTIIHWNNFKRINAWSKIDIVLLSVPIVRSKSYPMDLLFDKSKPRNLNEQPLELMFQKWYRERSSNFLDHDPTIPYKRDE